MLLKIFSQISSIIVALLFVYTINFKSFVTISYFANQVEITDLFCVNKEKPELQCNGKCHLSKQIVEIEKNEQESPFSQSNLSYNLDINLILQKVKPYVQVRMDDTKKIIYIPTKLLLCEGYYSTCTPPPKA